MIKLPTKVLAKMSVSTKNAFVLSALDLSAEAMSRTGENIVWTFNVAQRSMTARHDFSDLIFSFNLEQMLFYTVDATGLRL